MWCGYCVELDTHKLTWSVKMIEFCTNIYHCSCRREAIMKVTEGEEGRERRKKRFKNEWHKESGARVTFYNLKYGGAHQLLKIHLEFKKHIKCNMTMSPPTPLSLPLGQFYPPTPLSSSFPLAGSTLPSPSPPSWFHPLLLLSLSLGLTINRRWADNERVVECFLVLETSYGKINKKHVTVNPINYQLIQPIPITISLNKAAAVYGANVTLMNLTACISNNNHLRLY